MTSITQKIIILGGVVVCSLKGGLLIERPEPSGLLLVYIPSGFLMTRF